MRSKRCTLLMVLAILNVLVGISSSDPCSFPTTIGVTWLIPKVPLDCSEIKLREDSTTCIGEWDQYKTYCPSDKIKNYINTKIIGDSQKKWNSFIKSLSKYNSKIMAQVTAILGKLQSKKSAFAELKKKSTNLAGCNISMFQDSLVDDLKDFNTNFQSNLINYQANGQKCFETLRNVKSNVVCLYCSGRGDSILQTDPSDPAASPKLKLKLDACRKIISSCGKVFKFNFLLGKSIELVQSLRYNFGQSKKARSCNSNDDSSKLSSIKSAIVECIDSGNVNSCKPEEVSTLCSKFISLSSHGKDGEGDSTLIEDEDTEDATDLSNRVTSKLAEAEQAHLTQKRLLQAAASSEIGVVDDGDATGVSSSFLLNANTGVVPNTVSVNTSNARGNILLVFILLISIPPVLLYV